MFLYGGEFILVFSVEAVSGTWVCMWKLGCVPLEDDGGRWIVVPSWVDCMMVVIVGGGL